MMVAIQPALARAHDAFATLEPFLAPLGEWTAKVVTGNPAHDVARALFTYYFMSIACNAFIMLVSLCFSRRVVGAKRFDAMKPHERTTWHTNLCTFWPAFAVTAYALPAIATFSGKSDSFVSDVSALTSKACGLSIGYMTWDLGVILARWDDQVVAYGGKGALYLFIVHHVFSIVLWPYALMRHLCAYHINYFLVSEVTNFNMSLRWILAALNMSNTKLYLINGLAWIPLFLGVRVVVIPQLFAAYMNSDWGVLTTPQYYAALLTLPIPSLLNLYWAQQIVVGAAKFLITGEDVLKQD